MDYKAFFQRPSVMQHQQLQDEFKQRKQAGALNNQLTQAKIQDFQKNGGLNQSPASVREWEYYNNLPEGDRERYLQMKRSDQVMNLGGTMAVRNPTGGIAEQYQVTPKITETPEYMAAQSGAQTDARNQSDLNFSGDIEANKVTGRILGENQAQAQVDLPNRQAQAEEMLKLLTEVEQSPGLSASVGMPNPLQGRIPFIGSVAGSPAADFEAKLEQVKGKQFLEAYQSLKGGGQITEIEGTKAENAMARMQTSQSEAEFLKAVGDFKVIVAGALDRTRATANPMQASQQAIQQRQGEIGANPSAMITVINPNTNESFEIPESDYEAARQEGFMRLR